jgi:CBS domain-containing protein
VLGRLDILTSIGSGYARRTAPRSIRLPQEHRTVGEIMERDIPTVAPTTPLGDDPVITALTLSATQHLKRLPVVDAAGRLVGVVARPALLAASLDV